MELFIGVTFLVGLAMAKAKIEKGNKNILQPGSIVKQNKDRRLTGRTVMGCPFESICSLRAILRCLRER